MVSQLTQTGYQKGWNDHIQFVKDKAMSGTYEDGYQKGWHDHIQHVGRFRAVWPDGVPKMLTRVIKRGTGYSGPGMVRGFAVAADGSFRAIVAHTIADGEGEFFHIYAPSQLETI